MRSGLALTLAVVGLLGCGGSGEDGYPQESVDAFVQECRAQPGTSERQCRCVVERLQESTPYEEFARADEALKEHRQPDEATLEKLRAAVTACTTG